MAYALRPGLTFCQEDGHIIFLDVLQNRYLALTEQTAASFARLVAGHATARDQDQLRPLVGRILIEDGGSPLRAAVAPPTPRGSFMDGPSARDPLSDFMAYLAFRRAIRQVRNEPLESLVQGIERLKRDLRATCPDGLRVAKQVASSFRRAGHAASLSDRCLPHSIAVTRWLLRRGVRATLVIGVAADPFQAHSWAQVGDLLVNDRVEFVRDFVPILVL